MYAVIYMIFFVMMLVERIQACKNEHFNNNQQFQGLGGNYLSNAL